MGRSETLMLTVDSNYIHQTLLKQCKLYLFFFIFFIFLFFFLCRCWTLVWAVCKNFLKLSCRSNVLIILRSVFPILKGVNIKCVLTCGVLIMLQFTLSLTILSEVHVAYKRIT